MECCCVLDVPCSDPLNFNDTSIVSRYDSGTLHFGSNVTYSCAEGSYVEPGVYEYTSHCNISAEWNVTHELCQGTVRRVYSHYQQLQVDAV